MSQKRLLIISDTKLQKRENVFFGFNSVVLELEVFRNLFSSIYWLGSDYSEHSHDTSLLSVSSRIKVVALPIIGGKSVSAKIVSLFDGIKYIQQTLKLLSKVDVIHVRGPNAVSFLTLLIAPFYKHKIWWFKYANNWIDDKAGLTWRIQRYILKKYTFATVTVNGNWPQDPKHIIAFENPCINAEEIKFGNIKELDEKVNFLYVGRIEKEKGINIVMDFVQSLTLNERKGIGLIQIIGDGLETDKLKDKIKGDDIVKFWGKQPKEFVVQKMQESHFLLLPTLASEGFPKVVAEAWANSCIPIVTDVSCIAQYVKDSENGYVVDNLNLESSFHIKTHNALNCDNTNYQLMVTKARTKLNLFTYEHYQQQIKKHILSN
jgi:glycosyltransferase involved in cell wall biosynthesis